MKKNLLGKIVAIILAVTMVFSVAACGGDDTPPQKTFSLNKTSVTLDIGGSETLTITTNQEGTAVWTSSNKAVATVANGVVTAVAAGSATIEAKLGDLTAECAVTVNPADEDFNAVIDGTVNFSYIKDLQPLTDIDVVSYDFGNSKHSQQGVKIFGELVSLSVLQGLLARTEGSTSGIYLNVAEGGMNEKASSTWLDGIKEMGGAESHEIVDSRENPAFSQMLEKYKDIITKTEGGKPGYVLFEQVITDTVDQDNNPIQVGEQNVNAACTIAAATGYIAIDVSSKEIAEALGYELAVDATEMNEIDAYNAYKDKLTSDTIMLCNNGQAQNRDLGVALGTYFMYESNKDDTFMNIITAADGGKYKQGTLAVGWSATGEVSQVQRHGLYGFNFTCTNYSYNFSQTARIGDKSFQQKAKGKNITADPTKKYVTFIMTDGDNITWHQNDFPFSNGWYGYSDRGSFNMGWTMAPVMADIAPMIIKKEYEMATQKDQFVCGVSGSGYVYPSDYVNAMNNDALTKLASTTDEYMRRADLDYVEILDNDPFNKTVMDAYAAQENIKGGFILRNADYYREGGNIKYYNGKPFMGIGEAMWMDSPGKMAHRLNSLPVDTSSANGYTAVKIHCWSTVMPDVARMIAMLDENIEVVLPSEMMQLIGDNVKKDSARTAKPDTNYPADVDEYVDGNYFYNNLETLDKNEFNFDTFKDYEGWSKHIGSKQYDYVSFSGEAWKYSTSVKLSVDGGDGYSIRLDGSDYGNSDSSPNASIYAKLKVPNSDGAKFSFFARGEAFGFDAQYRVRVITNSSGKPTIESLDNKWMEIGDNRWREISYDVSKYKGQEIVFLIEHNSTDREGDGEILYVDNIKITDEQLSIAEIKKATVNPNTTFDFASDMQGFKTFTFNGGTAVYENGMLKSGVKASSQVGGKADSVFYTRFDLAKISGYTHYKFGIWAQAASGKTARVRLTTLSADGKQVLRGGAYQVVGDTPTYLSLDFDTYRIEGGAFKYAYIIIEAVGNGADTDVCFDNGSFAKVTRALEDGYLYDAEYLATMKTANTSTLSALENWNIEAGRGAEDMAKLEDGTIRLYGYDFMRGNDSAVVSKALKTFAKVKNEFNGRIYQRVTVDITNITFNIKRIEKTLTNMNAVEPRVRTIFIEDDGTVTVLKDWQVISSYSAVDINVNLASISGKTGVIMFEMDCAQNGDRAGATINGITIV